MKLIPKAFEGRNGYGITFRHPLLGKVVNRGLNTIDETKAHAICNDAISLFSIPTIRQEKPSPKFQAYERRAVEIVFDEEFARQVFDIPEKAFTHDDIVQIAEFREKTEALAKNDRREVGIEWSESERAEYFAGSVAGFTPEGFRELQERCRELEKIVKVLQPENDQLKEENARLRAQRNVTVKATIQEAFEAWKPIYKEGRKEQTVTDGISAVTSFIQTLPGKNGEKLRDVTDREIDAWIENLRGEEGQILSPITKRNRRNGVSVFMRWATKKFRLFENPMDKVSAITGVHRIPENIVAVKRLADLREMIEALKPYPYWQAWVTVACLAGPRFREQCYIKINDVYLDDDGDEIRVTSRTSGRHIVGTKTGRERRIPIERSILLPILREHVKRRKAEQAATNASENEKSPWLFPSTVDAGPIERTKTPPGIWSHNSAFLNNWEVIAKQIGAVEEKDAEGKPTLRWLADYWQYGPDEWRHTFGTALGMTGFTDLEIARLMGNSPRVCERHYVAKSSAGKRWPLQW